MSLFGIVHAWHAHYHHADVPINGRIRFQAVCERLQLYIGAGKGALERIRTTLRELDFDESTLPKSPSHQSTTMDDIGGDKKRGARSEEMMKHGDGNSAVVIE